MSPTPELRDTSALAPALRSVSVLMQLLDSAPDAIVGVAGDGRIVVVNSQTERLFGYERGELIGERIEKLVPERYGNLHEAHRRDYFGDPRTRPMGAGLELFGRRRDGSEFPAEISLSSIDTDDGAVATAAIRDISDRKAAASELARQAAELQRSNSELQQFAYVASHDLQEPLRMIIAYTDRLTETLTTEMDDTSRRWAGYVVEGAARMRSLVEGVLEFSRVRPDRGEFVETDLGVVLRRATANLDAAIEESGASITSEPLPTVQADQLQMLQLLQNLIANALKFRSSDPPQVHVGCAPASGGWELSVSDNGIGIDPSDAERVFDLFGRLHSKDEYPGAGIGLALCKKIVEAHGGRIWVEPSAGPGSSLHFTLPAAAPAA